MIVIRLKGGLGNQMFQYALGYGLSKKYNTKLKLDLSLLENDKLRKYELGNFEIEESFISKKKVLSLESSSLFSELLKRLIGRSYKAVNQSKSKFQGFNPNVLKSGKNAILNGYWQSEKYFKHVEEDLRKMFSVKTSVYGNNKILLSRIKESNSVFIHIRRADYVTSKSASTILGALELDYYHAAIELMREKVTNPKFFIFSDEPEWVKQNLDIREEVFYSNNSIDKGFEDIRLMSNCKHAIIANSSFSWWGAWLIENNQKNIIAPNKWYSDPSYNNPDIIPDRWIKV